MDLTTRVKLTCPNCHARLIVTVNDKSITCKFCGTDIPVDDLVSRDREYENDINSENINLFTGSQLDEIFQSMNDGLIKTAFDQLKEFYDEGNVLHDESENFFYNRIPDTNPNYGEVLLAKCLIELTVTSESIDEAFQFHTGMQLIRRAFDLGVLETERKYYLLEKIALLIEIFITHFLKYIKNEIKNNPNLQKEAAEAFKKIFIPTTSEILNLVWVNKPDKVSKNVIINITSSVQNSNELDHTVKQEFLDQFRLLIAIIKRQYPEYPAEKKFISTDEQKSQKDKSGCGCFIATATMQSPDHIYVLTLKRYRDDVLLKNSLGRKFISYYYKYSPPIANIIEDKKLLRRLLIIFLIKPIYTIIKFRLSIIENFE